MEHRYRSSARRVADIEFYQDHCRPDRSFGKQLTKGNIIMKGRIRRQLSACKRVRQFGIDHPLNPANAAATAAFIALEIAIAQVETLDSIRLKGNNTSLGATQ